ncbi:MAG TPA: peptide-methionine (S)-S-oxide reductase MsrA [Microlunatus sp.]
MGLFSQHKQTLIDANKALPGRDTSVLAEPTFHEVFGTELHKVPEGSDVAYFALGCFWGAEKLFWQTPGVTLTAAGYAGGITKNPSYEEVCANQTGHAEAVLVAYDPAKISYAELLKIFFENHDPTQGMRQGNDIGTQYRSAIYPKDDQQAETAHRVTAEFQAEFSKQGFGTITTEILPAGPFYYAEDYHQQYLIKVPNGYCPVHATGVTCNVAAS